MDPPITGIRHLSDYDSDHACPVPDAATIAALSLQQTASLENQGSSLAKIRESPPSSAFFEVVEGVLYKKNFSGRGKDLLLALPKPLREDALSATHSNLEGGRMEIAKTTNGSLSGTTERHS